MTILKRGMKGADVKALQSKLVSKGFIINPDGDFGGATFDAVYAFQKSVGLKPDGVVGNDTINALNKPVESTPVTTPAKLTEIDYKWAADYLGCDVAAVKSVNEVESPKGGFLSDGRVTILFERHIMRKRLLANKIDPTNYILTNPDIVNTTTGGYKGGLAEWDRLNRAIQIDERSALESASWGAYQIMGFNYVACGYTDVYAFVKAMKTSERGQLEVFVKFIKADVNLLKALRNHDWANFALRYNGKDYAKNKYDEKLLAAYNKFS